MALKDPNKITVGGTTYINDTGTGNNSAAISDKAHRESAIAANEAMWDRHDGTTPKPTIVTKPNTQSQSQINAGEAMWDRHDGTTTQTPQRQPAPAPASGANTNINTNTYSPSPSITPGTSAPAPTDTPEQTPEVPSGQSPANPNGSASGSEGVTQGGTPTQNGRPNIPEFVPFENNYEGKFNSILDEWRKASEERANSQVDYATQQAETELVRQLEDAQKQFKTQQDQIASDQMRAQDNAALYAEMRGDKGGIGQAQYNAIANTAAINRQTVAGQQTKLSTDTARQIADLRAQGEFEKADKVLEIAQTYLSQLVSLEQWAAEYGLTVEQFNESVRQWQSEYQLALEQFDEGKRQWNEGFKLDEANLLGSYKGQLTLAGKNQIADMAAALMEAGIELTDEQISALGITRDQVAAYRASKNAYRGGGSPVTYGSGYSTTISNPDSIKASEWDYVYNNILTLLREGKGDALDNYMNQVADKMSESQWVQTEALLNQYMK